ncbi:MAG: hypothetical protein GOVbin1573_31 [Prokaryotic dsDNA virus sp.]|nr:MAG: hypothetical protein GOVbin1573_31 [Prokaryotic dsDNA virus sp.]|tara:strand:- start:554 stop:781 length:228 start_codon:yes stop_codon:yes gene_type:complete
MTLSDVLDAVPGWVAAVPVIWAACGAVAAATPTKMDDRALGRATPAVNGLLRVLNVVALNVGRARNADDPKARKG